MANEGKDRRRSDDLVWRVAYNGTSLIRNRRRPGPYSRTMPRALWESKGGGLLFYERGTPVGTRDDRLGVRDLFLPCSTLASAGGDAGGGGYRSTSLISNRTRLGP